AWALRRAVNLFKPDVVHSFSRLAYLGPILPSSISKVMSYQRVVGARQVRWGRRLSRKTLRFTGCSEYIATLGRRGGGKWRAIPNFVEVEKYRFVPEIAADAPLVFLSRVESIKGPHLAIQIARQAGRRLIIAGNRANSGPESEYFKHEIAPHLGRDGIEWIGEVDDSQKNVLLGQAAALLVPIQWDEPFGIVFVEALAVGCPVITCARGALPEIITPGRTGIFIQNAAEGVRAVNEISKLDRVACRADAVNQFSSHVCAEQYLALYSEMNTPVHGA
ncbi:MAG TPA: glycosyltransferase, partial [Opitutaceae bacterium]